MAGDDVRVVCLHGLGGQEAEQATWQPRWEEAVRRALADAGDPRPVEFLFPAYDHLFADREIPLREVLAALGEMLGSGVVHGLFGKGGARGLFDLPEGLRWTAGMVVAWARDDGLRRATRRVVADAVAAHRPDVIVAHSLGSLIAYDALTDAATSGGAGDAVLLTVGSQVGNAFVRNEFGGYLTMPAVRRWVNVFNPDDPVLTARIRLVDDRFVERGERLATGHDAVGYLRSAAARDEVFRPLAAATGARGLAPAIADGPAPGRAGARARGRAPDRRALLVGIDRYPAEADRLAGCVNDTFLMSSLLQESGFAPEGIRLLLDERATSAALRERLAWLLDDVRPGDVRCFYYSGHGAQVPAYGPDEVVDSVDEVLVTHDFDWSDPRGTGVVDDDLFRLYAQLPYDVHFVMVLDCCHAGGMARGAGPRVRGVTPPDDVRHRALRWDAARGVWVERRLADLVPAPGRALAKGNRRFVGRLTPEGPAVVRRLGCASRLRNQPDRAFERLTSRRGHRGPYLPMILEACGERELSFEYEHGAQSFGAFTFTLARVLRARRAAARPLTFEALLAATDAELRALRFDQHPRLTGPSALRGAPVPWSGPAAAPSAHRVRRRVRPDVHAPARDPGPAEGRHGRRPSP